MHMFHVFLLYLLSFGYHLTCNLLELRNLHRIIFLIFFLFIRILFSAVSWFRSNIFAYSAFAETSGLKMLSKQPGAAEDYLIHWNPCKSTQLMNWQSGRFCHFRGFWDLSNFLLNISQSKFGRALPVYKKQKLIETETLVGEKLDHTKYIFGTNISWEEDQIWSKY